MTAAQPDQIVDLGTNPHKISPPPAHTIDQKLPCCGHPHARGGSFEQFGSQFLLQQDDLAIDGGWCDVQHIGSATKRSALCNFIEINGGTAKKHGHSPVSTFLEQCLLYSAMDQIAVQ
jgi:hypothetical protein